MDLFTEHYARSERMALDHDAARAAAIGVHVAEARRRPQRGRWATTRHRLRSLLTHPARTITVTPPPLTARPPSPTGSR